MIEIEDTEVLLSLLIHPYHPKMLELIKWFVNRNGKAVITQGYEKRPYPSVHSVVPVRGIDLRSWIYNYPFNAVDDCNIHWTYDPKIPERKCAILHDSGSGEHIHLQVSEYTVFKGGLR